MIGDILTILGPLIASLGLLPYLKKTLQKEVKPKIATWFLWSLITYIATIAALDEKAYESAILTGMTALVSSLILIAALKKGSRDYGLVDIFCLIISSGGIVAWIITSNPLWAIVFNILADFSAAIPTYYHSWVAPDEEAWLPYFFVCLGAIMSSLAVDSRSFVSMGFPIYLTIMTGSLSLLIFINQKDLKLFNKKTFID